MSAAEFLEILLDLADLMPQIRDILSFLMYSFECFERSRADVCGNVAAWACCSWACSRSFTISSVGGRCLPPPPPLAKAAEQTPSYVNFEKLRIPFDMNWFQRSGTYQVLVLS